jgi:antitoxin HigA-1
MANRYPRRAPKRPPTHSGAILREDVIPALGKSKAEIARRLGVSRQALYNVLSEKAPITPEMAVRIGKLCGNGAGLWGSGCRPLMTSGTRSKPST